MTRNACEAKPHCGSNSLLPAASDARIGHVRRWVWKALHPRRRTLANEAANLCRIGTEDGGFARAKTVLLYC